MSAYPFTRLADVARQIGADAAEAELVALRRRIEDGRFFVACVGQCKRGKSTLVNALVGASVLPVGVVPVTAVVTVVRFGPATRARVQTSDGGWTDVDVDALDEYVSEGKNPENAKGVRVVEVHVPSSLLASGMCLVDTPGLGSVFAGNTGATRDFIPHVDAALVVLGADPPISGEELELVAEVAARVEHLVFVINKADRLGEGDVDAARRFTREVLARRFRREPPDVLVVSAAERAAGRVSRDWARLEERLTALARDSGSEIVEGACRRGLERVSAMLGHAIEVHREALVRPLEESEQRVEALTRAVRDAERALLELEPLFRVEEEALARRLEGARKGFVGNAQARARVELLRRAESESENENEHRTRIFDLAQDVARNEVETWAKEVRPEAEDEYRRATYRFVTLGNDFLRRLREGAPEAFGRLPQELEQESGLRARAHFYFTELLTIASPPAGVGVLDALRTREQARRAAVRRATPYLLRLIDTNSSRVVNDLTERVRESGRELRRDIAALLRDVAATARRAADDARTARARGDEAVRQRLADLDDLCRRLARMKDGASACRA